MTDAGFIHLHVHSAYSLLEGALPIAKMLKLALADTQPAIGIADSANLFGALEFSQKAAAAGVQPIISCEVPIDFADAEEGREKNQQFHKNSIVLIACTEEGFLNLSELVSRAYLSSEGGPPVVHFHWFNSKNTSGLICLTGGPEGAIDPLFAQDHIKKAHTRLALLKALFDNNLYVELQRHGLASEQKVEPQLVDYAYKNQIPLVATNEPFFPAEKDHEAHDALLAIAQGSVVAQTKRRKVSKQHYFKNRAQMVELFKDLPEAIENTLHISRSVSFRPLTRDPILPKFAIVGQNKAIEGEISEADQLHQQAKDGLDARLKARGLAPGYTRKDYDERLAFELKIITQMEFPGYFLIVADFIRWAKEQNIPVGPGRGSGAGSLVAYVLTITDLDPLKYQLLFERFLNPDRLSMPDFDIDFCQERREEVIQYVQKKYGREQVAQIITFGTLQAKAALRDVGRVLQMPYSQVDRISKLVPINPANPPTIAEALEQERQLRVMRDEDETVAQLLSLAQNIEGLYRHASTHAAGIVIGDRPLQELVPLYRDPRSDMQVTQYGQKWAESAGLVKFDFLGLKTLTIIDHTIKMINRGKKLNGGQKIILDDIPLDDKNTFTMLRKGDTVGVFQVESAGMRRALIDMQPDRFEDLIALVALFRPGPMDNIPVYCAVKLGEEEAHYLHPLLIPILEATFGVITYQEQVQQIGRDLAGYTLAEADILRRAMGKKIQSEMDSQRDRFVSGAVDRGIDKKIANKIFDACAKFAEYGFNKSHSAPYAFLTYQTAYLKANFTSEFIAASMTLDMGNTDKLAEFKRDADQLDIEVFPPCVNRSHVAFEVQDGGIQYSLCALKGVGRQVAEHIVEARGQGKFDDLADFANRIDPRIINRRTAQALANAGAFDDLVPHREQAFNAIETIIGTSQRAASNRADGISDMFEVEKPESIILNPDFARWTNIERLDREHSAIGFHLSGHPLDDFALVLETYSVTSWRNLQEAAKGGDTNFVVAGTVVLRNDRRTRKGKPMAILTLSDPSGSFECLLFSETLAKYGEILQPGNSAIINVEAEALSEGVRLRLLRARLLESIAQTVSREMVIFANDPKSLKPTAKLLEPGGNGVVFIVVKSTDATRESKIKLAGNYQLTPDLASGIKSISGINDVQLT
ncbi:MAG: DNA polymerase III subunit alpha [Devosiaceae bacterium]|nr:DNA polymerase III subunit alpha [Devosiaceae bacterium]